MSPQTQTGQSTVVIASRTTSQIRLVGRVAGPDVAQFPGERRRSARVPAEQTPWGEMARLPTGHDVRVVDISTTGVMIESPVRMHVGGRVVLSLAATGADTRLALSGVVRRCQIVSLGPLTYAGALEFDQPIDAALLRPFVA